jgi:thiol-disulfide isomerase/thioredoxin
MLTNCIRYLILITCLQVCKPVSAQDGSLNKQVINFDSLFQAKQNESLGKVFPEFSVKTGNSFFNNQAIRGKTVFINFWFKACPPCIAELDALNDLYDSLKNINDFVFISFTYETPATIKKMAKRYKMQYKIFSISQQECYRLNQNNAFPTSIITDSKGVIKLLKSGGTTDKTEARKQIFDSYYPALKQLLKSY